MPKLTTITKTFALAVLLLTSLVYADDLRGDDRKYKKDTILNDAKGLALCYCFRFLNENDSLSIMNKDVSGSYFVEYSELSIYQMTDIWKFVKQNINSFSAVPWQVGHNMITYTCWRLYESDELKLFLENMLKD